MSRRCESCGAHLRLGQTECRYCGVEYDATETYKTVHKNHANDGEPRESTPNSAKKPKQPEIHESVRKSDTNHDKSERFTINFGTKFIKPEIHKTNDKKYTLDDEPKAFAKKQNAKPEENGYLVGFLQTLLFILVIAIILYITQIFWG